MRPKSETQATPEKIVGDIHRVTWEHFLTEENIQIVLDGRGRDLFVSVKLDANT